PAMRQRAGMMLDYVLADYAAERLAGRYAGAHSRLAPASVMAPGRTPAAGLGWLLFGDTPFTPRAEALALALSGYRPPAILHAIATDRTAPYVHRERKRTRTRIRYADTPHAPVYKYTFVRPEYALGSVQGGLLQPVQQHTWDLTWAADGPQAGPTTLFTLHPYA